MRLFDQETCHRLQEGAEQPGGATPRAPSPSKTLSFQELKMQVGPSGDRVAARGSDRARRGVRRGVQD